MNPRKSSEAIKPDSTIDASLLGLVAPFVAVARHRSFAAAARASGVSPSAMSQAIARLERELGAALLVRTTRSVNLTEAGARLLEACQPALAQIHESMTGLTRPSRAVEGTLRLNVPRLAGVTVLPQLLRVVHEQHPHLIVDVVVDDRNVDIVEQGFDAGVRAIDEIEKDMVAVRLSAPFRYVTVASPEYLERHAASKHPKELVNHVCLPWRSPTNGSVWRWEYQDKGKPLHVSVQGPVASTDGELLIRCAKAGLGLTYACFPQVADDLASGALQSTLDAFSLEVAGLFLYYPKSSHRSRKLAALVECAQRFARDGRLPAAPRRR